MIVFNDDSDNDTYCTVIPGSHPSAYTVVTVTYKSLQCSLLLKYSTCLPSCLPTHVPRYQVPVCLPACQPACSITLLTKTSPHHSFALPVLTYHVPLLSIEVLRHLLMHQWVFAQHTKMLCPLFRTLPPSHTDLVNDHPMFPKNMF